MNKTIDVTSCTENGPNIKLLISRSPRFGLYFIESFGTLSKDEYYDPDEPQDAPRIEFQLPFQILDDDQAETMASWIDTLAGELALEKLLHKVKNCLARLVEEVSNNGDKEIQPGDLMDRASLIAAFDRAIEVFDPGAQVQASEEEYEKNKLAHAQRWAECQS